MKKTLVDKLLEKEGHSASYLICSEYGSTDCEGLDCPLRKYCKMAPGKKLTREQYKEWNAYVGRMKEAMAKQIIETYLKKSENI